LEIIIFKILLHQAGQYGQNGALFSLLADATIGLDMSERTKHFGFVTFAMYLGLVGGS
jgi:hypothetical protein